MNYELTPDKQGPNKSPEQVEFQQDNPAYSSNSQQNQRLSDRLQPLSANAIEKSGLGKCNKPLDDFLEEQRLNSSEQKYYLCEYTYKHQKWSIELPANSWEDAEARLKRIAYGTVSGKVKAVLKINQNWLVKIATALGDLFGM